jgi:proline iminopeptidase
MYIRPLFIILLVASTALSQHLRTEEGYKDIFGTKLYYKAIGEGEPILVVHGGPGLEHSYFLPYLNELAKDHKLIFFDMRGHGKSDANIDSSKIQLSYFVDDIEQLRKEFGVNDLILMAHSFGGLVAENYAIKYPKHLKAVILISPSAHDSKYTIDASSVLKQRVTQQDMIDRETVMSSPEFYKADPKAYEKLYRVNFRASVYRKEVLDSINFSFPNNYKERSNLLRKIYPENWFYSIRMKLSEILCPVLIIRGEYEPLSKECYDDLHERLLHSTLVSIPECGHFPFAEAHDRFIKETTKFLKGLK